MIVPLAELELVGSGLVPLLVLSRRASLQDSFFARVFPDGGLALNFLSSAGHSGVVHFHGVALSRRNYFCSGQLGLSGLRNWIFSSTTCSSPFLSRNLELVLQAGPGLGVDVEGLGQHWRLAVEARPEHPVLSPELESWIREFV